MALLIHVAGDADLRIDAHQLNQLEVRQRRLAELREEEDADELARRILGMRYGFASEETDQGVEPRLWSRSSPPLAKEFAKIEEEDITGLLRVLIVGTSADEGATEEIARVLACCIERLSPLVKEQYGIEVGSVNPVIIRNLFESDLGPLDEELAKIDREETVILPIAGGASALAVGVAGSAIAAGHDVLMILAKKDPAQSHSLKMRADPIRGWLLGLGLPTVLKEDYPRDNSVQQAACSVEFAFSNSPMEKRSESLAQLLLMDIARGDLAAGMSIRAWVLAEFRSRLAGEECDQTNGSSYKKSLKNGHLKAVVRELEKRADLSEAERWLLDRKDLLDVGERATHEFASLLEENEADAIRTAVRQAVGSEEGLDFLSWPSEHVSLIYGVGLKRPRGRSEFVNSVMREEPPEEIRLACGVGRPLHLHTILLASSDSACRAHEIKSRLNALDLNDKRHPKWGRVASEVVDYGVSAWNRDTSQALQELVESVGSAVKAGLDNCNPRPRAVLVGALGEKEVLFGALAAAQEYGAQWGIPVFLISTVQPDGEKEKLQFHRFGLGREARHALLAGARYCMERLDLLTAYRLLALGDCEMRECAKKAKDLAEKLAEAVNAPQIDEYAPLIRDVFRVVADLCRTCRDELLKARVATIVGELIKGPDPGGKAQEAGAVEEPQLLGREKDGNFKCLSFESLELPHRLTMIYQVRNKTPLNHGEGAVDEAFETVLKNRVEDQSQMSDQTYSDLLESAADQIEEAVSSAQMLENSHWKEAFDKLLLWVRAQGDSDA